MHINNISQKAASFILHKRFHPGNYKNMEKVWLAEQKVAEDARKEQELNQKRAQELKVKELRKQHDSTNSLVPSSIQWVYAREEDQPAQKVGEGEEGGDAVKPAEKRPPKKTFRYVVDEPDRFGHVSKVDIARKVREDPLMLIKKAEVLRKQEEEEANMKRAAFATGRPRWEKPPVDPNAYLAEPQRRRRPSVDRAAPYSTHQTRRRHLRNDDDDSLSSGSDLGPPQDMRNTIRERHSEAINDMKRESNSQDEEVKEEGYSLADMIEEGKRIESARKCRLERLRLLNEEADAPRAPVFMSKVRADVIDSYVEQRGHRGSKRRVDPTVDEDRHFYDD